MQCACAILSNVACCLLQNISTLSHKQHDFTIKVIEHKMCVCNFSTSFVRNISNSKKNSVTYYHKCTLVFMQITFYSCQILMKLEFPRQFFEKWSSIQFRENLYSAILVSPCGRTDRRTANRHCHTNSHFSKFYESS